MVEQKYMNIFVLWRSVVVPQLGQDSWPSHYALTSDPLITENPSSNGNNLSSWAR